MHDQLMLDESDPTVRLDGDEGASLVEYALLLALIVVVCIGAMTFLGSSLDTNLSSAGSMVEAAGR